MTNLSLHSLARCLAPFALVGPAVAADSAIWRGAPSGPGDVIVFDVAAPGSAHAVAVLTGIRLLPLEFAGHSAADEFAVRFPRRRDDIPGAARLVLQQSRGSLYRYVRPGAATDAHGFFVVDGQGARVVFELAVPAGAPDPIVGRVAVAFDGSALLVATTPAAGGDLFEIDVASGLLRPRTANLAPLDFGSQGLALGPQFGFAVHASGALRFTRALNGDAQVVNFPAPAPQWFSRELVVSTNGAFAATTAGVDPTHALAYSLGASGAAVQVGQTAMELSGAGFFPAAQNGPHLAISDDGSTVAWRSEGAKREAFVAHVSPPVAEVPEQLTSDAKFLDTLDEIGLYGFRPLSNTLVLAIGKGTLGVPNTLDAADLFAVNLPTGAPANFVNLSLSSGVANLPFNVAPKIKPDFTHWIESANAFVVHDGGSDRVLVVKASQSGAQVLLNDAKSLDWMEPLNGDWLLSVRSAAGNKPQELWRVSGTLTGAPVRVATFPSGDELTRVALRPDGWLAFVETGPLDEFVWRYSNATAQVQLLSSRPLNYGPSLGFAPSGELLFSVGKLGAPALFGKWPTPGAGKRLPLGPLQPGFVLPGA
ncbi:MAG: hypothetical protein K8S98_00360 [Planctomycetes bacterium]|nr:hypothetical protein [Planctomycetota bacterium]